MARQAKKELISQREYARRLGVSHVAVQRAVKTGRISAVGGKIDPAHADQQWQENTDQSKPRNRITGKPKQARSPEDPSEPMDMGAADEVIGSTNTATGYAKARAARELYQAQLAKLELDRQRGTLIRADEVRIGVTSCENPARRSLSVIVRYRP